MARTITTALVAGLLGGTVAQAQVRARIVEYGATRAVRGDPLPGREGQGLSPARPLISRGYVEQTERIAPRLCGGFGVTVAFDADGGRPLPRLVQVRVLHPTFTRPDGATSREDRYTSNVVNGRTRIGFTFDHPWEMQPGPWTIVVGIGKTEVARQDFTVMPPESPSASECGLTS